MNTIWAPTDWFTFLIRNSNHGGRTSAPEYPGFVVACDQMSRGIVFQSKNYPGKFKGLWNDGTRPGSEL